MPDNRGGLERNSVQKMKMLGRYGFLYKLLAVVVTIVWGLVGLIALLWAVVRGKDTNG